MLDVGEHQLLVLLLVIESKLHEEFELLVNLVLELLQYSCIDVSPIFDDFSYRRPRQETTSWPSVHLASRVVIRVEEVVVLLVKRFVVFRVRQEHETFEEPRHVREVPLGRAYVGHTLDHMILDSQVLAMR